MTCLGLEATFDLSSLGTAEQAEFCRNSRQWHEALRLTASQGTAGVHRLAVFSPAIFPSRMGIGMAGL